MSTGNSTEPLQDPPRLRAESSNSYVLMIGLVMLVGILILAWIGRAPQSNAVGEPLPRIDLQPLVNVSSPLSREDFRGKFSVIHFWGTWCPPCIREFPDFVELATEFQSDDRVQVISVSCSAGPEYDLDRLRAETEAFLSAYSQPIPTYSDSTALTRQQIALLLPNGSLGYPTTIVVDPEGTIIKSLEGFYPGEMVKLSDFLRRLADQSSPSLSE